MSSSIYCYTILSQFHNIKYTMLQYLGTPIELHALHKISTMKTGKNCKMPTKTTRTKINNLHMPQRTHEEFNPYILVFLLYFSNKNGTIQVSLFLSLQNVFSTHPKKQ